MNDNKSFQEQHPVINAMFGMVLLILIIGLLVILIRAIGKLDAVIIVALITGCITITCNVISSIVSKNLEYKRNREEYLAKKLEQPYGEFIEIVYKIQGNIKDKNAYTDEAMIEDIKAFSKQLTLWGSPTVVKKWNEFRINGGDPDKAIENMFILEEIMNEMRNDIGREKLGKGELLSFFVNDIKDIVNNK